MSPGQRILRLVLAVLPWGVLVLLVIPGPWHRLLFTPGHFREWIGLPCPLCGGTRAMRALFVGDWTQALYLNPLAPIALAICMLGSAACFWEAWRGRALLADWNQGTVRLGKGIALGLALFWIYHAGAAWLFPKEELLNRQGLLFRVFGP